MKFTLITLAAIISIAGAAPVAQTQTVDVNDILKSLQDQNAALREQAMKDRENQQATDIAAQKAAAEQIRKQAEERFKENLAQGAGQIAAGAIQAVGAGAAAAASGKQGIPKAPGAPGSSGSIEKLPVEKARGKQLPASKLFFFSLFTL